MSDIVVTLPDGSELEVEAGSTVEDVAYGIGPGLGEDTVGGIVDGDLAGREEPLEADCELVIITEDSEEYLRALRHSAAHVFAQALGRLHPGAKLAIGPPTEEGFYYDVSSIETLGSGAAPLADDTRRRIEDAFDTPLTEGWGMTETSPAGTTESTYGVRKGAGSIGQPLPDVEIKLVDPETRETRVPAAALDPTAATTLEAHGIDPDDEARLTGEIAIHGPNIFEGYQGMPKTNDAVFENWEAASASGESSGERSDPRDRGWFYTADIARVDEDRFLWMVDRADDMLIVGGENVYPAEVEDALFDHSDVQAAAVVGADHETKGEAPVAFVVTEPRVEEPPTERELRKFGPRAGADLRPPAAGLPRRRTPPQRHPEPAAGLPRRRTPPQRHPEGPAVQARGRRRRTARRAAGAERGAVIDVDPSRRQAHRGGHSRWVRSDTHADPAARRTPHTAGCNSFKIPRRYPGGYRPEPRLPDGTASRSYSRQYHLYIKYVENIDGEMAGLKTVFVPGFEHSNYS